MAENSELQQANLAFRSDVINRLLESTDLPDHVKASVGGFLGSITTDTKHEALAYHLFCTVIVYISERITLGDEQEFVLTQVIEKIRQEWKSEAPSDTKAGHDPHEAAGKKGTSRLEAHYPYGYRVMTEQGWSDQKGLGPNESGIPEPIDIDTRGRASVGPQSSIGLGYKKNAVNDTSTTGEGREKPQRNVKASAVAWNDYTMNPRTGDETAKSAYTYDGKTDKKSHVGSAEGAAASANASVEISAEGQYVLNDEWKPTSPRTTTPRTHAQISPGTQRNGSEVPSSVTYNFAHYTDNSKGW